MTGEKRGAGWSSGTHTPFQSILGNMGEGLFEALWVGAQVIICLLKEKWSTGI